MQPKTPPTAERLTHVVGHLEPRQPAAHDGLQDKILMHLWAIVLLVLMASVVGFGFGLSPSDAAAGLMLLAVLTFVCLMVRMIPSSSKED